MHKKITTDISVRFKDIDSMGHVNNAVYFTYFEEGRKEFFRTLLSVDAQAGYNIILAHISCDFKKPVLLSDAIAVQLWVGEIGKKKFEFIYQIVDRQDASIIYASGRSIQVCYDYQKNKSTPIPPSFLDILQQYTA